MAFIRLEQAHPSYQACLRAGVFHSPSTNLAESSLSACRAFLYDNFQGKRVFFLRVSINTPNQVGTHIVCVLSNKAIPGLRLRSAGHRRNRGSSSETRIPPVYRSPSNAGMPATPRVLSSSKLPFTNCPTPCASTWRRNISAFRLRSCFCF